MNFENTLRYSTFADRSQVENRIESYETLIIPSNLLIGGQNAIPPLVHQLYESGEVDFYIDPTITEFHRGVSFRDGGEIKAWHQKLIEELGAPLEMLMEENDNLVFSELTEEEVQNISKAVCRLQRDFIAKAVEEQIGKYEAALIEDISPRAIVPWYVKIEENEDIAHNLDIIGYSEDCSDIPLKPTIHVDKEFLSSSSERERIAQEYANSGVSEVFLWVDDLKKSETMISEYVDVIRLIVELVKADLKPHALYGDYFMNLMAHFGLRGIGFGTYHSEDSAEKLQAGGGGNLQRYYFGPVKEFLSIPDAVHLGNNGNAPVPNHSGLSSWNRLYKMGEDHDFLKNHFIRTKDYQRIQVLSTGLDELLEEIKSDFNTYQPILENRGTTKNANHLKKWANAIELYMKNYPNESESAIELAREKLSESKIR